MTIAAVKRAEGRQWHERFVAWADIVLSLLALVMLVLLVLELAVSLGDPWDRLVVQGQIAIWVVFVIDFFIELALAPDKLDYLRKHWFLAIALVVPALRVFRVLRAVRVLRGARVPRGLNLVRIGSALRRASGVLQQYLEASQFAYLVVLTIVVTIAAGAGVYFFERGHPETSIRSFGDALWWAATTVTTVNSPLEAETTEGRIVGLALRLFGLAVIGYLTARLAVFLIGRQADEPGRDVSGREIRELRLEMARLREAMKRASGTADEQRQDSGDRPQRASLETRRGALRRQESRRR